jgi:slime mold repeat-containing protein
MRSKSEQASAAGFLKRGATRLSLLALVVGVAPPAHARWTQEVVASLGRANQTWAAVETCLDQPDGTACDDGQTCTEADACTAGTCQGRPITCTAPDACHSAGVCNPATGTCTSTEIRCEDGDPCTEDSCDPSTGCVFQPVGGFEAVTCLLVTATLEPAVCRPMPVKIEKLTARAASQIAAAASGADPRLQKQLLMRATHTLNGATKSLRRIGKRRGLSPLCADALTRVLGNLVSRVDQLRNSL